MALLAPATPAVKPDQPTGAAWRWTVPAALALYCIWAGLLIWSGPGLQYDEALLVLGSVHMRHSSQELALPHDPSTWICPFGRCFPLMTVRYVGAIKEYLCLPLFAAFGPSAAIVRIVSALLGLLGIWGLAKLLREQLGIRVAAFAAFLIAMHPAYTDLTVFDNGTVSVWMAAMGLLAVAASRYVRLPNPSTAFWLGVAAGMGVWARANFVWLLAAFFASAVVVLRRRKVPALADWIAAFAGMILGAAPLLIYQFVSRGGTWEAAGMFATTEPMGKLLAGRLRMFSQAMLSDGEHRAIWGGPSLPQWQVWFFCAAAFVACLICLLPSGGRERSHHRWAHGFGLGFLLLGAFLFFSRMPVAEHHMVVLVPLAAVLSVLASLRLADRFPSAQSAIWAVFILYLGCASYWQTAAVRGMRASGGIGQWSDGVSALARHLEERHAPQEVKILDWGLQNNLYVLTDGRLRFREVLDSESSLQASVDPRWIREIERGGVFLINGPANRQLPASSTGFLRALAATRPATRHFTFPQRSGQPFAEVFEIEPHTAKLDGTPAAGPLAAEFVEGFYEAEPAGWRWTKREFAMEFHPPAHYQPARVRLTVDLYVPDISIRKVGAMTLTARTVNQSLGSESYREGGNATFTRVIEWASLKDSSRVTFALDKSLAPSREDNRELGIVVTRASLDEK